MNGPFSDERRSSQVSRLRRTYPYASAKTFVRPCSSKKLLIHELWGGKLCIHFTSLISIMGYSSNEQRTTNN
jgi:hypothetical protein